MLTGRRRGFADVLEGDAQRRVAAEGGHAGEHLIENQPKGVDVGAAVHRFAFGLFGGHVGGRADERAGGGGAGLHRARDAEIHHLDVAILIHHHVFRLEVAVDDFLRVGLAQGSADLPGNLNPFADRQGAKALQNGAQAFAFHEFHRDVGHAAGAVELVHAADVLVGNLARQAKLVLEALHRALVGGDFRPEDFQRHQLAGLAVARLVHDAHAAAADFAQQVVARPQSHLYGCGGQFQRGLVTGDGRG